MTRATSAFLDVLRLAAAFTVFLAHTAHFWNPEMIVRMQEIAHDAVIVFFVLSGYVIAFTTGEKKRDARHYAVARLSRLYSVVAPAIVLTWLLWYAGRELDPELYAHYQREHAAVRFAASATFMNEVWFFDLFPPSNNPFWSLGYEFWFYVFFGVAVYARAGISRVLVLAACAAVAGPKVLLLLPVWLAGVAAFVWRERVTFPRGVAVLGFVVSTAATLAAVRWLPDWPQQVGGAPWYFSGAAATDLLCGIGWATTIWFFSQAFGGARVPEPAYRVVRWTANHTFSLYLFHAPLVVFVTAIVPPVSLDRAGAITAMAVVLATVVILGAVTEAQRPRWQALFMWLWDKLIPRRIT